MVNNILMQFTDQDLKLRILKGFETLTPASLIFNHEKKNKIRFTDKFNEFCVQTYGLLFIK